MKRILRGAPSTFFVVALLLLAGLAIRSHPAAAEGARALPLPAVDRSARSGDFRGRRPRRRLLLGCAGRVPARQRRDQRRLRICRRRQEDGGIRNREQRQDGARGIGAGDVRPAPDQLRTAAPDFLLGGPRSDGAQSTGTGYRDAVPLSDLPHRTPSRRTSRRRTSRSSIRPTRSRSRSSRRLNRTARSIRPRTIIRIS